MAEKTVVKKDRFPAGRFLAWSGRGISVAGNVIVLTYLSIFCTDTPGLAPALVGILFMVSKVIDAITDLVAGYVIDNTKTRFGKARPYEFCIILLWLCPSGRAPEPRRLCRCLRDAECRSYDNDPPAVQSCADDPDVRCHFLCDEVQKADKYDSSD